MRLVLRTLYQDTLRQDTTRYYRFPGTSTTHLFAVLSLLSCSQRIIAREYVCLYPSRHFSTSYVGSLCAGRSTETGNVGSANKTISARSTLNIETPEIAAPAHSGLIYRKRSTASTLLGEILGILRQIPPFTTARCFTCPVTYVGIYPSVRLNGKGSPTSSRRLCFNYSLVRAFRKEVC